MHARARRHCKAADLLVTDFKTSKEKIAKNCRLIAETLLVRIEKKKIYEEGQFEEEQARRQCARTRTTRDAPTHARAGGAPRAG